MPIDWSAIRDRFPLRDQIRRYGGRINHQGRFSCLIPGHKDKNPSANIISVMGAADRWHCHACGRGGDVIDLVSEHEGIPDRADAARHLWGSRDLPQLKDMGKPQKAPGAPETKREEMGLVFTLVPVPDEAPPIRAGAESPPILSRRGKHSTVTPADVYGYHLVDGTRAGLVLRIVDGEGKKKHMPVRWDLDRGWVWAGWSGDDTPPLYNAPAIARREDAPVLVVEGEKCAKLAKELLREYVVTCWQGGVAGVKRADFALLKGREVTFWPDNDDGGKKAMKAAAAKAWAGKSWWVEPSQDWVEGFDIADLIKAEGVDGARSWLSGKELMQPERAKPELPPPGSWQRASQGGWVPDDDYIDLTKDGTLNTKSEINAWTALLHHPFFAGLAWDVVRRQVMLGDRDVVAEADFGFLQKELARHTQVRTTLGTFGTIAVGTAMTRLRNPLAERLRALRWDGIRRPLAGYAGVRLTAWSEAAFDRWFLGLIARILEPGTQHDIMLVLEGDQGQGKTSFLRVLASPFGFDGYAELSRLSDDGSAMMKLDGKLLVELSEMGAYRKTDREIFKSLLTAKVDRYRRPYAKVYVDVPRTNVFAGTTNTMTSYLTDMTGNRRIAPVRVVHPVQVAELQDDLEQVYAEGVARYDALVKAGGPVNWFTPEELQLQAEATAKREQPSVLAAKLDAGLATHAGETIDSSEVWIWAELMTPRDRRAFQLELAEEMHRRGYEYRRGTRDSDRSWKWRRTSL